MCRFNSGLAELLNGHWAAGFVARCDFPHAFGDVPRRRPAGSEVFLTNRLLATEQPVRSASPRAKCCHTTTATRNHRPGRDKVGLQKPHLGGLLAVSEVRATCETFGDPCAWPVQDDLAVADSEEHKDMLVGALPRERARQVWRNRRA